MKVALFTDTLGDVNGVSRFIQDAAKRAHRTGRQLNVHASTLRPVPGAPNIHNFRPHYTRSMKRYPELEWVVPPVVQMLRAARRQRPDAVHISTPGPVGMVGVLAAWQAKAPLVGVYHTDFPAYVEDLWGKKALRRVAEGYMRGFYGMFRSVMTRSTDYLERLRELGIAPHLLHALHPGIDTQKFHPGYAHPAFWNDMGLDASRAKLLYVGRVSKEKNLPFLADVWERSHSHVDADLIIVGDGPYRQDMEARLRGTRAHFLGYQGGDELSRIYANSDLFLFPSRTDTLGQVVMESQASGLPALVTDAGGPQHVIQDGRTGHVLPTDQGLWAATIEHYVQDRPLLETLGHQAHLAMQRHSFDASFEAWWALHQDVCAPDVSLA